MNARDLYKAGKLGAAIDAMNAEVRARPTDTAQRGFLVELLCVAGTFERADQQLEALTLQAPDAAIGAALVRQLIRAAQWRQQFWNEGRVPEFLGTPPAHVQLALRASILLREGDLRGSAALLVEAEEARPHVAGVRDGTRFDDFRDSDDPTAAVFEVLTSTGKYYWIPTERVMAIEMHKPERPRDLLWRPASMTVRDGPEGEVFLPTIYAADRGPLEDSLRMGRATDWVGGEGEPVRGRGLRTFLVGDQGVTILDVQNLSFGD